MKPKKTFPSLAPAVFRSFEPLLHTYCVMGAVALVIASAATTARADQTLITFDDLPATTSSSSVPKGYQHLNWINFGYLDGLNYGGGNPSGYRNSVVSANQVAYSGNPGYTGIITNALGFDLISGYLTAAWRDGLQVRVVGSSNTVVLYDQTYTLSTLAPTFISFNYRGVTQVSFFSSGGTHNPAFYGDGYQFAMDDATVSVAPITSAVAGTAFDQLWSTFDRDYAMFVLRPEVDWNALRDQYRPLATNSTSVYELADVFTQMLRPLQDLHVWLTVSGSYVPVYTDSPTFNANPAAYATILGTINSVNPAVQWTVTKEKIGFIAINSWSDMAIPALCHEALEQMRDTQGLIIDVRSNGGGSESLAMQVAARFEYTKFVYAFDQIRNGTNHTDLTPKLSRTISPYGLWRYDRPVLLLIGQLCMSSDESFIGMMTGATNVTTMGDHTRGSSGNPETVQLPLGMAAGVPTWIDYLPDGTLLDRRGFQPQIPFTPAPGDFTGTNDALLSAAVERLRLVPLPAQPILGPLQTNLLNFDDLSAGLPVPANYRGLTWSNFYAYDARNGSWYKPALSSAPNIIYNRNGTPAGISANMPFDLYSAVLTAGYRSNLNLEVIGYLGTNVVYDTNVTLSPTASTTVQFNCYGVDSLKFISSGGTPFYGGNYHFAMDDLVILQHSKPPVQPLLQNVGQAGGATTFVWAAQAGQIYQVQYTDDLAQTNWSNLGTPLTTGNYALTGSDPSTNRQRFYRVLALP